MDALEKALGKEAFLLLDEQLGKKWVVTFWDILFSFKGWGRIAVPAETHADVSTLCTHFPLKPEFQDDLKQDKSIFWGCRWVR